MRILKKRGEVIKESNFENENIRNSVRAFPNSNKFSTKMLESLGSLMNIKKSLKLIQDESGRASILGILINTLGGH